MPVSAFAFSNNSASVLVVPKTNGSVTVGPVSFPPAGVEVLVELEVPPHPTNKGKSKRVRPKCFFHCMSLLFNALK